MPAQETANTYLERALLAAKLHRPEDELRHWIIAYGRAVVVEAIDAVIKMNK